MTAVRIENEAFSDLRFEVLAKLCHLADADHARGKMLQIWRQCTASGAYVLGEQIIIAVLGDSGATSIVESGLGERVETGIRIKGTRGRIEWLKKLRKNAQKGGKAKAAKRQKVGKQEPSKDLAPPFPPTLTLTPAQEEKEKMSAVADRVLAHLGSKNGIRYRGSKDHRDLIAGRLKDGVTEQELIAIVDRQAKKWPKGDGMHEYLRPETLFGPKTIGRYLDAAVSERGIKPMTSSPLPDEPPSNYDDYGVHS